MSSDHDKQVKNVVSNIFENIVYANHSRINTGNINCSYFVEVNLRDNKRRIILQRINPHVLPHSDLLEQNLIQLSIHLNKLKQHNDIFKNLNLPKPLKFFSNNSYLLEYENAFWRVFDYIDNCITLNNNITPESSFQIGRSLSLFHLAFSTIPTSSITANFKHFHHTPSYFSELSKIYDITLQANSDSNKLILSEPIYHELCNRQSYSHLLETQNISNENLIHGDPKLTNFLFIDSIHNIPALIDLDTVSFGMLHHDIGDCLRSISNLHGEDSQQFESITFNLKIYYSFLKGYLYDSHQSLSFFDLSFIPPAIKNITFELALRFLTDFLLDNQTFNVTYKTQNLDRAKVQLSLLRDIEYNYDEIYKLLEKSISCYQNTPDLQRIG